MGDSAEFEDSRSSEPAFSTKRICPVLKLEAIDSEGKQISNILFFTTSVNWQEEVQKQINDLLFYDQKNRFKDCIWFMNGKEFFINKID